MTLPTHPNTRKYLLYPLAIIMLTYLVQRAIEFWLHLADSEKDLLNLYQIGLAISIIGVLVGCYGIFKKQNQFAFIGVLLFSCGPLFSLLNTFLNNKNLIESVWSIFYTLFSIPVLSAIFSLFVYRKYFFTEEESSDGILSLLGVVFLISGLLHAAQILVQSIQHDFFYFNSLIQPGVAVLVGIGILVRERLFGIFGFLVMLSLQIYNLRVFFNDQVSHFLSTRPLIDRILFVTQVSIMNVVILIMLLLIFRTRFNKNFFAGFSSASSGSYGSYSMQSKSCSNCGKSVSIGSTVGQRCPHCGVYWGYEKKV